MILAVILIAAAIWYWRRKHPAGKSGFAGVSTPATPRVREAVGDLSAALGRIVGAGSQFLIRAEPWSARLPAGSPPLGVINGARRSADQVVRVLRNARLAIEKTPPTYTNYASLYKGLVTADSAFLGAARGYLDAGEQAHQIIEQDRQVEAASSASTSPVLDEAELAELGVFLIEMSRLTRSVVVAVHRLGVALDLE